MADEGDEEEGEESDIFERRHELAVSAVYAVVHRLLHGVRAADHGGEAATQEDARRRHHRWSHNRVSESLDG